jgi:uncharacterized membrane protein
MDLILVIGLAALFAAYVHLAVRIGRLEAAVRSGAQPAVDPAGDAAPGDSRPPARETLASLFEQLVAGRLLIWIGGVALVVAGFFLVRHTIEIGLITPGMRMVAAAFFGLLLLALGEYARRGRLLADDPRIAQALVGAGIAVLYATAYGSWYLYGQIGGSTASALMFAITVAALILALRHGAPTAAMGTVGGFLTPWLVGNPESGALPILAYIALLNAAIFTLAWKRGWTWLAAGSVALSFVWTGYLIFQAPSDALAAGVFVLILALAASFLRPGEGRQLALMQPLVIGLVQLAALTIRFDSNPGAWLLFGALSAASLILAARRPEFRLAPPVALVLALLLIAAKALVDDDPLVPLVAAATTLMFAGVSIPLSRTDRIARTLTACGALVGPILILRLLRPELLAPTGWGLAAALLSIGALALLRIHRTPSSGRELPDVALAVAAAAAAVLLALAGHDLTPHDFVSATWLVVALALVAAGIRLRDKPLRLAGLMLLTATILKVFLLDAAALSGVLRILSFLGLGIALIAMGKFYGTVLRAERKVRHGG